MTLILLAPAAILAGHHRRLVLVLFLAFFLDRLSSFTPLTVVSVRQHREQQEHHSPPTGITMADIRFVHSLGLYVRDSSARLLLYRLKPQRRCSHVVFSTLPPNDNANKNDKDNHDNDPGDARRMPNQNAINGGANTVHIDGEKIPKTIVTPSLPPTLPQGILTSLPDKGDLYPVDELEKILNLHQTLADNNAFDDDDDNAGINDSTWSPLTSNGSPIRFHELVLQAVEEADQNPLKETILSSRSSSDSAVPAPAIVQKYAQLVQNNDNNNTTNNLRQRLSKIRAIASDVDGTLLNHNLTLHPMTRQAIQDAVAAMPQNKDDAFQNHGNNGNPKKKKNNNNNNDHGNDEPRPPFVAFFPATGKTRAGALHSLGPDVARWLSKLPGVFGQGLQCVNATGHVVFEQKLDPTNANNNNDAMMMGDVMDATEAMVHQDGLTLVGVNGDVLYTTATSAETNPHHLDLISSLWGEPRPLILPNTLSSIRNYKPGFHKLIVMADTVEEIQAFRPKWEALAKSVNATILSSVPTLLELLPPGCGKEVGVRYLCESLGIDMGTELLAIGDGENDLKMLQQAAVGVAMGNAVDLVKQAHGVDIVLDETNEEGGAGLAISLFGLGKVLEQQHECDG
ncbi:hypothetical protein ACA910_018862 [Epithemia clementina (nom. ined.)]